MEPVVVRVENVSKRYRVGALHPAYQTFREALVEAVASRVKRFGRGRADSEANTLRALDGVSLEVRRGEILGVVGRNGAGKSTLLKILSRITRPSAGRVEIYGRVGSLLEVGTGFHPDLTGRENIFLNGAVLGMRKVEIEKKFDEIVAFSELERFVETPVKFYSSGMYVRLAFSVAAHLEPEILIMDEVLAVGDMAFGRDDPDIPFRRHLAAAPVPGDRVGLKIVPFAPHAHLAAGGDGVGVLVVDQAVGAELHFLGARRGSGRRGALLRGRCDRRAQHEQRQRRAAE